MLVIRLIDVFMMVTPEFDAHGANLWLAAGDHSSVIFVSWLDVVVPIAIGGIWLWGFWGQLRQRPLLPIGDPYLAAALESEGGH